MPVGRRQRFEAAASASRSLRYSASTSAVGRLCQRDEHLVAVGISYGTMAVSSRQHPAEAIAEDRLHPAEVADQLFQRPFAGHRAASRARFVEPRGEPPDVGGLRAQALHQRQMHGMFVA